MEEEVKDVAEVVPAEETVVNEEQVTTPVQEEVTEEVTSTQEVKPEVHDDRPVENVAWEVKRKLDETIPNLQKQIEELSSYIKENKGTQQPEYTRAQLNAYALDPTTTTEQRLWALTEVKKKEKSERIKDYESLMNSTRQKTEAENRRAQTAQWVSNTFPETVIKDNFGNVNWNNNSPLLAKANEYMSRNQNLRNDPEGFAAAVKMAAFDMGVSMNLQNKVKKTVGQLRKEQKKGLASSGGTQPAVNKDSTDKIKLAKLQQKYAETNDRATFQEIIKLRKLNPFV